MLNTLLRPASLLYGAVVARRNRRFDVGHGVVDTGMPVISIGNLTVGGTGKTPLVQWVAQTLTSVGHRPAVALRGYGSRPGQPSDEAIEHREKLPGVPVLANPDRVESISIIRQEYPACDVVILDDGFQHRRVARVMDVVLLDARRSIDAERLLPAGRLREPLRSMARATDIVVTHSEHAQDRMALEAEITRLHGHPPVAWCNHLWNGLDVYSPTGTRREPVEYLSGLPVIARFGVARPDGPRQTAVAAGATIVKEIRAADHAPVGPDELQTIERASADADALLVTGKDWAKLRRVVNLERLGIEVIVPDLGLDFVQGESLLVERLLQAASSEHL